MSFAQILRRWRRPHQTAADEHRRFMLHSGPYDAVELEWAWRDLDLRAANYARMVRFYTHHIAPPAFPYRWPWRDPVVLEMYRKLQTVPTIPAPSVRVIDLEAA